MNDWLESVLHQMPAAQGTLAADVDWLFYFIFWVCLLMFIGIVGTMLWFVYKYRAKKGEKPKVGVRQGDHHILELFWTFAPLILLVYLFHAGFQQYAQEAVAPPNAMDVRVRAKKWSWEFVYPTVSVEGELYVPADRPIRLVMSSQDVLHAFFIPGARQKKDVVPGMYSTLWFQNTPLGPEEHFETGPADHRERHHGRDLQVFCAEYCGTGHHAGMNPDGTRDGMQAIIHVVPREDYQAIVDSLDRPPAGMTEVAWGESLFTASGCPACHVLTTNCPRLNGVIGHPVDLEGGGHVESADLAYVTESIRAPSAKVVRGYGDKAPMTPFPTMSDNRIHAIYEYLSTLQ